MVSTDWLSRGTLSRARLAVFALAMALLPISEWRIIKYQFYGPRSFSVFHVVFLLSVVLLLALEYKQCISAWKKRGVALMIVMGPLLLFFVAFIVRPPAAKMVTINGLFMSVLIMVGTFTSLMLLNWEDRKRSIRSYLYYAYALLIIPLVVLTSMYPSWHTWLHYEFSGYFSFPFYNTTHSAFFVLTVMLLLSGMIFAFSRASSLMHDALHVTIVIAVSELAIGLAGNRTAVGLFPILFGVCFLGFTLWAHRSRLMLGGRRWVVLPSALLIGLLVGSFAVVDHANYSGVKRAAWMLDYRLVDVLTGRADEARHALWSKSLPLLAKSSWSQGAEKPIEGFDATLTASAEQGNLHSTIIDLYVWAGPIPAALFYTFLLIMTAFAVKRIIVSWNTHMFPLYWACLLVMIQIVVYTYVQPVEYLGPVWAAMGVVLSILLCNEWPLKKTETVKQPLYATARATQE